MRIQPKAYLFLLFSFWVIGMSAYQTDSKKIVQPTIPPHLVNDFAGLLTIEQVSELESDLVAYNDSTSTQICIVTIDTLSGIPIDDYALELGRTWGIGQKGKNNGVLVLVSKNDRQVKIEVGYGLEPHLTDYACHSIIENSIIPNFKSGNYFSGIKSAVYSIKYFIAEYPATSTYSYSSYVYQPTFFEKYGYIFVLIIVFLIPFLSGIYFGIRGNGSSTYSGSGWTSGSSSSYSGGSSYSGSSSSYSSGSGSSSFSGYGGGSFGGGGASGKW